MTLTDKQRLQLGQELAEQQARHQREWVAFQEKVARAAGVEAIGVNTPCVHCQRLILWGDTDAIYFDDEDPACGHCDDDEPIPSMVPIAVSQS